MKSKLPRRCALQACLEGRLEGPFGSMFRPCPASNFSGKAWQLESGLGILLIYPTMGLEASKESVDGCELKIAGPELGEEVGDLVATP